MAKWRIKPANDEAAEEAALLFKNQEIKRRSIKALNLLAEEENPARPQNTNFNIKHVKNDAPTWYRLRLDWKQVAEDGENMKVSIRIFFSLAYIDGERTTEYGFGELPFDNAENYIRVEQIGHRTASTYIEARRRWRRSHRK